MIICPARVRCLYTTFANLHKYVAPGSEPKSHLRLFNSLSEKQISHTFAGCYKAAMICFRQQVLCHKCWWSGFLRNNPTAIVYNPTCLKYGRLQHFLQLLNKFKQYLTFFWNNSAVFAFHSITLKNYQYLLIISKYSTFHQYNIIY